MTTSLRDHWRAERTTLGGWLSLPSPVTAEVVGATGFEYVCVDLQHGVIGYSDLAPLVQALLLGGTSPLVRVPWNEPGVIGKVLDAGAHGVIVPMVNSPEEAEAAVRACRYAREGGARSWGPVLAAGRVEGHYADWAADHVAVIPMVETTRALEALDEIVAVPGVDAVYVGPADLSLTLGLPPGNHDGEPVFDEALERVVAACRQAGVVAGIHSTGGLAQRRVARGFGMVTVVADLVALRLGLAAELAAARADDGDDAASSMY